MFSIDFTRQYLKDLKLARKRRYDEQQLNNVIQLLISGNPLPVKYKNHSLSGEFPGNYECHITPDWLLVYSRNETDDRRYGKAVPVAVITICLV